MKLSPAPSRTDLTDRECSVLVGGLLGGLVRMADLPTLRRAVRWWAETDDARDALRDVKRFLEGQEERG